MEITSTVERVEFISVSLSYITLRCDIIVLNMHAPTKDNSDDTWERFYKELRSTFNQLPDIDQILVEPIPITCNTLWSEIHKLTNSVLPQQWRDSVVYLFVKGIQMGL
jgi:hypothetical protein